MGASETPLAVTAPPPEHHHRFEGVSYCGTKWDLSHLDSFACSVSDVVPNADVTVVFMFSCHCFSHSFARDSRDEAFIPECEIYDDGVERRVLDPVRYEMSRQHLRAMVVDLPKRHIIVANAQRGNFMTWDTVVDGAAKTYVVFFEVEKPGKRKLRLIVQIQSAYVLEEGLTKRQKEAKKVRWSTILRAAYEGRKISP